MSYNRNDAFWPSYVDIMTTLFAIMLILFAVSFTHFKQKEGELQSTNDTLREFKAKYDELISIYSSVENIDTNFFEFNSKYVKHIFKLDVKFDENGYRINGDLELDKTDISSANALRKKIIQAGKEIERTIRNLKNNDSIKQDIKYLVVIEGQASKDGFEGNDILSFKRALNLNSFWINNGINLSEMDRCELIISGSGEKGVPRAKIEKDNQRFLIHIVPVIGNIHRSSTQSVGVKK